MTQQFDVVIIGGGPAGCAAAIALKKLGVQRVLIAESDDYTRPRIGESIPPDTRRLFSRLGILDAFLAEAHLACLGSYSSWGSDALGYNDFLFNPLGTGWHLDRLRFDRFMVEQARLNGAKVLTKYSFRQLTSVNGDYPFSLSFSNKETIRSRFVVDASGRTAKVARRMGVTRKEEDALLFVSAYMHSNEFSDFTQVNQLTLLEAVEYGWWYTARLPGERIIVALASAPKIITQRKLQNAASWWEALQNTRHTRQVVGSGSLPMRVNSWLATSSLLNPPSGVGWLAIGDAASCFDPISSQGIYKALSQALEAAPAIADYLADKQEGLLDYRQFVGNQFIEYLEQRAYFYDLEQRWPNSAFWQSRHSMEGVMKTYQKSQNH